MTNTPFLTPGAGPLREAVERRSATVVVWLAALPRLVPITAAAALFLLAILAGGVIGGLILLLIAAIMAWISYLSWPSVPPLLRGIRLLILAGVVAVAVAWMA
jgi:hypothetical protein